MKKDTTKNTIDICIPQIVSLKNNKKVLTFSTRFFKINDNICEITEVNSEPYEITYKKNDVSYTLNQTQLINKLHI